MIEQELQEIIQGAKEVLKGNDLGGWTKPAPNLYPHQWNWDSAFIAIGLSRYDLPRAMQEIRSLLKGQWKNGLVPQIVFNPEGSGYFPGPDVWQCDRSPNAPDGSETSGITQPPVLSTAVLALWNNAPESERDTTRDFLREVYPKLLLYHRFFYEERNPDGNGLIVVVHPWESGTDNSPRYLDAGKRVTLTYRPQYKRLDTLHVNAANRPTDKDYDLFVYLLEQMRAVDWDQKRYLENAPLQVQDVLFNSVLCRANNDLAIIAELIGEDPAQPRAWHAQTRTAINDRCWDAEAGIYFDRDRVTGELIRIDTISGLLTLFGELATPDRAERIIESHLTNPRIFWPTDGFPISTTGIESSWFNAQNYWLGPAWVSINWMLARGLASYGRADLSGRLITRTLEMIRRSGYHEYFDPFTGAGYGTGNFSWTAALSIDFIAEMNGRA
jgi:hypothetical protein